MPRGKRCGLQLKKKLSLTNFAYSKSLEMKLSFFLISTGFAKDHEKKASRMDCALPAEIGSDSII